MFYKTTRAHRAFFYQPRSNKRSESRILLVGAPCISRAPPHTPIKGLHDARRRSAVLGLNARHVSLFEDLNATGAPFATFADWAGNVSRLAGFWSDQTGSFTLFESERLRLLWPQIRAFWHSWVRRYDALSREQTDILARHPVTVGNTGVTKRSVVERGALQRYEALEG